MSEGRRSLGFLRPLLGRSLRAPVVAVRPPRPGGSVVLQLGWGTPWCMGRGGRVAGARARDRCHRAPLLGGALGGLSPHPLCRPLVCRGSPWPCVRGVLSPRRRAGRRPREVGGGRAGRSVLLPGGGPCEALPVALARLAWERWGCAPVRCGASWTGVGDRWQMMSVGR